MLETDAPNPTKPSVLVADDNDDIRQLMVKALSGDGYNVLEARDGREVLEAVINAQRAPDVIVLDVQMPEINGLALLAGLRNGGWTMPIIIITAYGAARLRDHAERMGATALFGKPFEIHDLRMAVMNLLRPDGMTPFHATLPATGTGGDSSSGDAD
jgi:CheY-like chemotaxis protein